MSRVRRRVQVLAVAIFALGLLAAPATASAAWVAAATATVQTHVDSIHGELGLTLTSTEIELAAAQGSSQNVWITLTNTSDTVAWTAIDAAQSLVGAAPPFTASTAVGFTCSSAIVPVTTPQAATVPVAVPAGASTHICLSVAHQRAPGATAPSSFALDLTFGGQAGTWTTGTSTVRLTVTVVEPPAAEIPQLTSGSVPGAESWALSWAAPGQPADAYTVRLESLTGATVAVATQASGEVDLVQLEAVLLPRMQWTSGRLVVVNSAGQAIGWFPYAYHPQWGLWNEPHS